MARAFVAVVPPADALDAVEACCDALRTATKADVRWTRRATWHLTLCFLGDDVDLDDARARFATIEFAPAPACALAGLGAFPRPSRARVVWVGLGAGSAWFDASARAVHGAFRVDLDHDEVHPHLTIARLRTPANVSEMCDAQCTIGSPWTPREVVLFESVRVRGGVEHVVRATRASS